MHLDWGTPVSETLASDRPLAPEPPALRLVRSTDGPSVSVVLATQKRRADLDEALPALASLCAQIGAELVVIGGDVDPPFGRPVSRLARYVQASADASLSQMRELAMSQCTGDLVVFLDDAAASHRSWIERVRASTRRVAEKRGGVADRAQQAETDWSFYLKAANLLGD